MKVELTTPQVVINPAGVAPFSISKDEALELTVALVDVLGLEVGAQLMKDDKLVADDAVSYAEGFAQGWDMAQDLAKASSAPQRVTKLTYGGEVRYAYVYGVNMGQGYSAGGPFIEVLEIGNTRDGYHDDLAPRRYFLDGIAYPRLLELDEELPTL